MRKMTMTGKTISRGAYVVISMTEDGAFALSELNGETIATCTGPRALLRYAKECEAQEIKHNYDCRFLDGDI